MGRGEGGPSHRNTRSAQRGVALVITLVLLVVITTLAVAFLALSYRETAAVSSALATTDAGHAADAALERAQGHILAQLIARNKIAFGSDVMGPDLIVSVARDVPNNLPLPFRMNVWTNRWANPTTIDRLFADPAVPVLIWTNKSYNTPAAVEARDYVDLNRNGTLEATGFLTDVNDSGLVLLDANGAPVVQWRVGDPQWIGILRDPTRPHGKDNHFIARYAFILLPTGRSLDVNWIHNQAIARSPANDWTVDGYFRNQGVGTYELNLAAFLADVNTNYWNNPTGTPYLYSPTDSQASAAESRGDAFADAREFLSYRYASNKANTAVADALFRDVVLRPTIPNVFSFDLVDAFANGPLVPFGRSAGTALASDTNDNPAFSWPGSDSRRHFFTIHDFLDVKKLPVTTWSGAGFLARLGNASSRINTEDRSTYYRILSQLGTDSPAERDDRLNLNFKNFDVTNTASLKGYATNFVPWTAAEFFHAAADRMLTNEFFPYGLTNIGLLEGRSIPIYARTNPGAGNLSVFGFPIANSGSPSVTVFTNSTYPLYSPRIHQLLQVAVNIYEATQTNDNTYAWPTLPTVMRPISGLRNGEIHIVGYMPENSGNVRARMLGPLRWYDLPSTDPLTLASTGSEDTNFFDIPILFGARKGFPNFNELTMNTTAHFARKVQVQKDSTGTQRVATNQMLIMSVSNSFVCEFWNSYSNFPNARSVYPRDLEMSVGVVSTAILTNTGGFSRPVTLADGDSKTNYAVDGWSNAFRLTKVMKSTPVPASIYYQGPPAGFVPFDTVTTSNNRFEPLQGRPADRWGLQISNRVLCFLFDGTRLVDAYASARMNARFDLSYELDRGASGNEFRRMWNSTNGIQTQLEVSGARNPTALPPAGWEDYQDLAGYSSVSAAKQGFYDFLEKPTPDKTNHQAGFSPSIRLLQVSSWEANDPLVHYTVLDLFDRTPSISNSFVIKLDPKVGQNIFTNDAISGGISSPGTLNRRYKPWGGRGGNSLDNVNYVWPEKDPGVFGSDFWDFPTQKLPNLGWLGRIHRGTPWQTVYLKADDSAYSASVTLPQVDNAWWLHVGAAFMPQTFPTNDWRLLDLFTAAIHPNATRGRLSINQTNVAAWSAVFGGLRASVLVNNDPFWDPVETNISPASVDVPALGANAPLLRLVEGINRTRGNRTFRHLSDFMAVPELTINSPFLPGADDTQRRSRDYFATDADWEKIPQQILSLVKVGEPRYVVYAWGQSLKPADYTPGIGVSIDPGTQVPRNYQITGEVATRAVMRVEFGKDANGRTDYRLPHTVVENFNILPNE